MLSLKNTLLPALLAFALAACVPESDNGDTTPADPNVPTDVEGAGGEVGGEDGVGGEAEDGLGGEDGVGGEDDDSDDGVGGEDDDGEEDDDVVAEAQLLVDLMFMREEEKLARDVYLQLFEDTGIRVFTNIAGSEQQHTDAVLAQIVRLGGVDPVVDDSRGVFVDEMLGELHDDLVTIGQQSDLDAIIVGMTIEDLDIRDLHEVSERTDDPEVLAMYDGLTCGSRNHMRAFYGQLMQHDGTYVAQFIDQDEMDDIVNSPREQCGSGAGH